MRAAGRDAGAAKVIIDRQTLSALEPEQSTTEYPPPLPHTAGRRRLWSLRELQWHVSGLNHLCCRPTCWRDGASCLFEVFGIEFSVLIFFTDSDLRSTNASITANNKCFLRFLLLRRFFNVFIVSMYFLLFKTFIENSIKKYSSLHVFSSSYTAPRALGIKHEVKQVRAKVFHSRFVNVFNIFSSTFFFTSLQDSMQSGIRSPPATKVFTTTWIGSSSQAAFALLNSTQLRKQLCWSLVHRWWRWFQALTRKPSYRWQTCATRKHAKNCSNSTCLQRCRW